MSHKICINPITGNSSNCCNKCYFKNLIHFSFSFKLIIKQYLPRIYPFNGTANALLILTKSLSLPKPPFRGGLRNGRCEWANKALAVRSSPSPFYIFSISITEQDAVQPHSFPFQLDSLGRIPVNDKDSHRFQRTREKGEQRQTNETD